MAGHAAEPAVDETPLGLKYPATNFYHRGHAWVREEPDGTVTVGLDDFASRLTGRPDSVALPPVGTKLQANGAGRRMSRNGAEVRILAPVDGEVLAIGGPDEGFYLKLRPLARPTRETCCEARRSCRGFRGRWSACNSCSVPLPPA